MEQRNAWHGFLKETARTIDLKAHKCAPAIIYLAYGNVIFAETKLRQFIKRQVEPAGLPVFTDIAEDIGQLQGNAQLDGIGQCRSSLKVDDVHDHQANGRGHAIAISGKVAKGCISLLAQITGNAFYQLRHVTMWNVIARLRIRPGTQLLQWPPGSETLVY